MKFKAIFTLLSLASILLLCSCEGATEMYYTVNNQSGQAITVKSISYYSEFGDTTITEIAPGVQSGILHRTERGGRSEPEMPSYAFSYIGIVNEQSDSCTKDWTFEENWPVFIRQLKRMPSEYRHDYSFIVTDSDF